MPIMRAVLEFDTKDGTSKLTQVAGGFEKVGQAGKSAGDAIKNGFLERIGKTAFDGLLSMLKSVPALFMDSVKAQAEAVRAINMLNLALANQGKLTDATSKSLIDYAAALQDVSTFDDETILGAEAMAASFGMNEKQIKQATKVALDFAAATGRDLPAAMEILGKAFIGKTASLGKLGIVVDETKSKTEKYAEVIDQLNSRFGGAAAAQTQDFAGGLKQLQNATNDVKESIGKLLGELLGSDRPFGTAIDWAKRLQAFFGQDLVVAISEVRAKLLEMFASIAEAGPKMATLLKVGARVADPLNLTGVNDLVKDLVSGGPALAKSLRDQAAAVRAEGDAAAVAAGKTQQFSNSLHPVKLGADDATKSVKLMDGAVQEYYKNLDEQARSLLSANPRNLGDLGFFAPPNKAAKAPGFFDPNDTTLSQSTAKLIADAEKGAEKWQRWGDAIATVAQQLGGTLGPVVAGIGGIFDGLAARQKQAAANLAEFGSTAMTTGQKVQAGAQAAAGAIAIYQQAYQSKSVAKGAVMGAAQGAAQGSSFGAPGVIVGAVVGLGLGIFGAKKGQAAEMKALTAEFDALMAQAQKAGIALTKAFDTKSAKGLKQAIIDLNKILADTSEAQEKLNDAIDRYGFTVDELGPMMSKQKLDEQMGQIYQDWQLLTAAGVDHEAMLTRIGPSVGTLVDQYKTAGVEIPAAMKGIIDDLYQHGKLLHENGEAYTEAEYNGLTYAQTMSQMFADLIKHVEELVAAIRGIPDKTSTITVRTVRTDDGDDGGDGPVDPGERPGPRHALGLNRWVLPGEPAMTFAEAGRPEYVYASSNGPPAGGGGGQAITVNVTVQGDGDADKIKRVVQRALDGGYIKVPA